MEGSGTSQPSRTLVGAGKADVLFGKVHYEIAASPDVTCFGGIAAIHRLVTKLGLVEQIDDGLDLLKEHLPYHESDHVLNLTYNVMCGGTRLEDIELLRHDTAYVNALGAELIPDPTTAGDCCRRFQDGDVIQLQERIDAVRPQLSTGRGRKLLDPIAYVDVDGRTPARSGLAAQQRRPDRAPERAATPRRAASRTGT